ncbi:MAG: hypothetical protein A2504_10925 [Bdellovibrionales bacterium RIFOXYD12_FULL_39_22]|nr:MAG: hypothetical protein A2385_09490 [Bdellovibrionales bacterium RIFOXYB1_FULL_39_21]OFZ44192.1 MAG: hypothetical protein A2485_07110 [Bdellovibrionales bacterium RIFOXYC12_FULL_39_17]OFZ46734.1 MAG: hypothetical protein A2404_04345 [Bdellovibrionales bacterium RIFOXYC1_FULL_39_130]OFZ74103.1 MAG: hypothetical protein A2451_11220 [Bdellovibrionales bacterium RIFOXYC2_FULL_39_8]OFZ75989.1 MAG: hypothetical protein A2560_02805 [Bdellovibrionales bacterium RIFOXYD1_FULL_39_84]OFZ95414.1 MAG:
MKIFRRNHPSDSQLELNIPQETENDRNFSKDGRSFYFFDFDDNIMHLSTKIVLFHKESGEEKIISSHELASEGENVGKRGQFVDYKFNYDDQYGSFRYFRDKDLSYLERLLGKKQSFVADIAEALQRPDYHWKGPSWKFFHYAVYNRRPVSIITARGHYPETICEGIKVLVKRGHLPRIPNYLCIYPVSNKVVRMDLGDSLFTLSTAQLKKVAIIKSVESAFLKYGNNPHHRFGMSDDDPKNVELIEQAMIELKKKYNETSFFVIDTHNGGQIKKEIFVDHIEDRQVSGPQFESLSLFDL